MARRLTPIEVHKVKLLICEGFSQTEVSRALDVSQGTVSKICLGDTHRDIPWPNPEVGEGLMRKRGRRDEQDQAQARLTRGVPQLPEPRMQIEEIEHTMQEAETSAVEQAREKVRIRAEIKKKIYQKVAELEEEEEREFRAKMTAPREGGPDQNDPAVMPTAWEVKFLPWEEVQERGKGINLVEVVDKEGDEITKRAIGIVFFKMDEEEWEGDQALQVIASIAKQLKLSQTDKNKP